MTTNSGCLHLLSSGAALGAPSGLDLPLLGGLRVKDVARSYLVSESTMAKRLVRAKNKIKSAAVRGVRS